MGFLGNLSFPAVSIHEISEIPEQSAVRGREIPHMAPVFRQGLADAVYPVNGRDTAKQVVVRNRVRLRETRIPYRKKLRQDRLSDHRAAI